MAVIFVNRFFFPDHSATSQMLSDVAFGLVRSGHAVSVITSQQRYDDPDARLPKSEVIDGVSVHRLSTTRFGRHNLAGRAIDYVTFYALAAATVWKVARPGDVVVAKTDPPLLSVVLGPVARWRRARLVNWLQDVFPEVAAALGLGRSKLRRAGLRLLQALRDRSLKKAVINVAIGQRMAEYLRALGVPDAQIRVIPNWADGAAIHPISHDRNALRRAWHLENAFVVGYSGNLGRAHEIETVVQAIAEIEQCATRRALVTSNASHDDACDDLADPPLSTSQTTPMIRWLFVGGGAQMTALKNALSARGLSSALFRPYQPREVLAHSLSVPDVHLISLLPELEGLIVPSKYYGIAAAGRPAIFIGDAKGEIAQILKQSATGITIAPGDGTALAQAVLGFASHRQLAAEQGERARLHFGRHYDMHHALDAWRTLLADVAQRG